MHVRRRLPSLPAILWLLLLGASSCVIRPATGGDVTFIWDFGPGQMGCSAVPGVSQVTIEIAGQRLENDGVYGCSNGGVAGITLYDFAAGSYDYTIEGRDGRGAVLYESGGTFRVNGSVTVPVTLAASPSALGSVYLTWTLPGGRVCSAPPEVRDVWVTVDQGTPFAIPCSQGQTAQGAQVTNLAGGAHQLVLSAEDAQGFAYYGVRSTLDVYPGGTMADDYQLDWVVGGLAVQWRLWQGSAEVSCAQAGVSTVYVNLYDAAGHAVYDPTNGGEPVDCVVGQGLQGTLFSYLYPGTYKVVFQARPSTSLLYTTDQQHEPTAVVIQGTFPSMSNQAPVYDLVLQ